MRYSSYTNNLKSYKLRYKVVKVDESFLLLYTSYCRSVHPIAQAIVKCVGSFEGDSPRRFDINES